ncbi:MAG: Crp/Fnr family transcriptional regulator [Betaproteobacteria bacterium]|nr:Crp/Fnr family transcriptional regulator [Betaproteobacteria bacterium]
MSPKIISQTLANFSLFKELGSDQIEKIAEQSRVINFQKGQSVFNCGDQAIGLYILVEGQLKLGLISSQGTERILRIISPSESFGEAILYLERQFPVYAKAIIDSKVLLVPKNLIFSMLDANPHYARKMLAGLSIRMHQLIQNIEMLSLQSSTQRFITYLLQISAEVKDGTKIRLPASKATIASLLNLKPETLSRILAKLQKLELIDVRGSSLTIIALKKLRSYDLSVCEV